MIFQTLHIFLCDFPLNSYLLLIRFSFGGGFLPKIQKWNGTEKEFNSYLNGIVECNIWNDPFANFFSVESVEQTTLWYRPYDKFSFL